MGKLNKPRGRVGAGFTRTESTKTVDGRKLLGNVELSRAITRAGVPRGVAVASIARLPSSTDDPPSSGSTADRHEPVEDWGSTRGHVHRFPGMLIAKGGGGTLDPHACNPRATAHHCSARDTVAGPTPIAIHRRT